MFPGLNSTPLMYEVETLSWNTDIQVTTMSQYKFWQSIIANPLEVIHRLGYVEGDFWCLYYLFIEGGVPLDIAMCGCFLSCHQWRELTPYEKEASLKIQRRNINEMIATTVNSRLYQICIFTIISLTGTIGKHPVFGLLS